MFSSAVNSAVVLAAVTLVVSGCNSGSPTEPQRASAREVSGTITFTSAGPNNTPIASHSESGFVVQFRSVAWQVSTGYGNPAPFPLYNRLVEE